MNCQHEGCTCQVEAGQEFCSDYCRDHASETGHGAHACGCGHPGCAWGRYEGADCSAIVTTRSANG